MNDVDFDAEMPAPTPPSLTLQPYRVGVHASHCCIVHGCKYGKPDCPVKTREVGQEYPCEECPEAPTPGASADELLHLVREGVSSLTGSLDTLKAAMPGLHRTLTAFRDSIDELDRQMTHGRPMPGDWAARR